jgi:hypothetical protein
MKLTTGEHDLADIYDLALGKRSPKWHGTKSPGPRWRSEAAPVTFDGKKRGEIDRRFFALALAKLKPHASRVLVGFIPATKDGEDRYDAKRGAWTKEHPARVTIATLDGSARVSFVLS